jgi:hypothetical protein
MERSWCMCSVYSVCKFPYDSGVGAGIEKHDAVAHGADIYIHNLK